MTLDSYLANRRQWEFLIGAGIVLMSFFANLGVVWIELGRAGDFAASYPLILEGTSHIAMAAALPLVFWFDRRFAISTGTWQISLPAHALFSVVFSFVHVVLMFWGRQIAFALQGDGVTYHWDSWIGQFGYEYLKDFRTYILIIAFLYLYRFVIRRLQGEAGFVSEGRDDNDQQTVSDRFLIKKLGREFLVRMHDIDWIESCGNYVNLHVGKRVYPLRDTMTNISERLIPHGFQRVHRSAIVNLDRVSEIVAFDTGDGEARLGSDTVVPVSRRFKKELRERLG